MELHKLKDHIKGDTMKQKTFLVSINGSPADMTDASVRMHLRKNKTAPQKYEFSTENGKLELTTGGFIMPEQIVDIPAVTYYYDIEIIFSDGTVATYIGDTWTIIQDTTY